MEIHNRKDFITFQKQISTGNFVCADLMTDLDLSDLSSSGPVISCFAGSLNGHGHTIKINIKNIDDTKSGGLFGEISPAAKVESLIIDGKMEGGCYTGSLCGFNKGIIVNCVNKAAVVVQGPHGGGLVGWNGAEIAGCTNYGTISGKSKASGIVGENGAKAIVENCTNYGDIQLRTISPEKLAYGGISQIWGINFGYEHPHQEHGKIKYHLNNSKVGAYLEGLEDVYSLKNHHVKRLQKLLREDPNTEYTNDIKETYLHLLCSRAFRPITDSETQQNFIKMIVILATETDIDFAQEAHHNIKAEELFNRAQDDYPNNQYIQDVKNIIRTKIEMESEKNDDFSDFSAIGF